MILTPEVLAGLRYECQHIAAHASDGAEAKGAVRVSVMRATDDHLRRSEMAHAVPDATDHDRAPARVPESSRGDVGCPQVQQPAPAMPPFPRGVIATLGNRDGPPRAGGWHMKEHARLMALTPEQAARDDNDA